MVSKSQKNFLLFDDMSSNQYRATVIPKMSFLWDPKLEKSG